MGGGNFEISKKYKKKNNLTLNLSLPSLPPLPPSWFEFFSSDRPGQSFFSTEQSSPSHSPHFLLSSSPACASSLYLHFLLPAGDSNLYKGGKPRLYKGALGRGANASGMVAFLPCKGWGRRLGEGNEGRGNWRKLRKKKGENEGCVRGTAAMWRRSFGRVCRRKKIQTS